MINSSKHIPNYVDPVADIKRNSQYKCTILNCASILRDTRSTNTVQMEGIKNPSPSNVMRCIPYFILTITVRIHPIFIMHSCIRKVTGSRMFICIQTLDILVDKKVHIKQIILN